jgi:predicted Kef-type K+ transport protein
MNVTRVLHIVAGAFILISLALAHYVSPKWLYFTAFVGINLFQSGFTNWCMLANILKKMGIPETAASAR